MEQTMKVSALNKVAEVELIYKTKVKPSQRAAIKTSKDCYDVLMRSWSEDKIEFVEQFKILLLNRSNKVLGIFEVSTGGVSGTVADPKTVFIAALKANSSNVILAHNHPSGSVKPSTADEELTRKLRAAGNLLDIRVLDHLIVTSETYYSFADEGLM